MTISTSSTSTALVPSSATDRIAEVSRNTAETRITVRINLDGTGQSNLRTGIGFFDHMLEQIARHGLIDLEVDCDGDLHIDGHINHSKWNYWNTWNTSRVNNNNGQRITHTRIDYIFRQ